MIKPPKFWQQKDGATHPVALLLKPVSAVYNWIGARRIRTAIPFHANGPVICVGNVSLGGVGKTPFSIMLAEVLKQEKLSPAFLTRGYGGNETGPHLVTDKDAFPAIGDEALILARQAPTCVSADRPAGARKLFDETKTSVLIMDDGLQNPDLAKDASFLLVDAETGFGNGAVFPSGPLREKPDAAHARAAAVVFILPEEGFAVSPELLSWAGEKPVFRAWLEPAAGEEKTERVVAFCGIGRPQKFYRTATAAGYDIVATRDFADHHKFTAQDLAGLEQLAAQHGAGLLTTEKDLVRLPAPARATLKALPVRMRIDKEQALKDLLLSVCRKETSS